MYYIQAWAMKFEKLCWYSWI